jgi:hypothetical protein
MLLYDHVYCNPHSDGFPSNSNEELRRWVSVANSAGGDLTFKLLTPSKQIIFLPVSWSALDPHYVISVLLHADNKLFVFSNKSTPVDPNNTRHSQLLIQKT